MNLNNSLINTINCVDIKQASLTGVVSFFEMVMMMMIVFYIDITTVKDVYFVSKFSLLTKSSENKYIVV